MTWFLCLWDPETEEHLRLHGVTPAEFEEVVSPTSARPIAFGYTSTGKYLACVYELVDHDSILPVTAFEVEGYTSRSCHASLQTSLANIDRGRKDTSFSIACSN